jgi:hypothetical protein
VGSVDATSADVIAVRSRGMPRSIAMASSMTRPSMTTPRNPASGTSCARPELFRGLWFRASDRDLCEWDHGAVADKGRCQALLRAIYKVDTIADPIPGTEPEGVWAELLAAMEADEELSDLARYWRR